MMAHSCVSNTHISVDDNFVMSVHARVDIQEDEPILTNYTDVLLVGNFFLKPENDNQVIITRATKRDKSISWKVNTLSVSAPGVLILRNLERKSVLWCVTNVVKVF